MATVKKGLLKQAPEWWKHLKWAKRTFWKSERSAVRKSIKKDMNRDCDI